MCGGENIMDDEKKFDKVSYKNQFNREKYDRVTIMLPKGNKEMVTAHAKANGESMNSFVNRAIEEAMERDKARETAE